MRSNTKVDSKFSFKETWPINYSQRDNSDGPMLLDYFSPLSSSWFNLAGNPEYQVQNKLFDEFCITSMSVTYKPTANYTSIQTVNSDARSDPLIYSVVDRDGQIPFNNTLDMSEKWQQYDSCKRSHYLRRTTRTVTCKKFWVNCQQANVPIGIQYQPFINAGLIQTVGFYGQNMPGLNDGDFIGNYEITYRVQFRGKKSTALTYDPKTGSVIVTPIEAMPNPVLPSNITFGIRGQNDLLVSADASGNLILKDLSGNLLTKYEFPDGKGSTGPTGPCCDGPTGETGPTGPEYIPLE